MVEQAALAPTLVSFEHRLAPIGVARFDSKVFEELRAAYAAPDRFYHDLTHIAECLRALDSSASLADAPHEIAIALWFHDAVYDTHRSDNERRSAEWAARFLETSGAARAVTLRIGDMILATQHQAAESRMTGDVALLLDIDLGILGQPAHVFDRYDAAIRREYHWVAEDAYRQGRSRVLGDFLARARIYSTPTYFDKLEATARANLARAIRALSVDR